MTSLANLRQLARDYIKIDPNGKLFNDNNLDSLLNRAYFQVQKDWGHRWREQDETTTITTTAGIRTVALPSDFIKLEMASRWGLKFTRTDKTTVRRINPNDAQWQPNYYYIDGSNIGFDPVPDGSYLVVLDYFKRLPTMTASVGSELPVDFDDAICLYATYLAFKSINKPDMAQMNMVDYLGNIQTLVSSYLYDDMDLSMTYQKSSNTGYVRSDVL